MSSNLPYSLRRIAEQRVGELVQRPQLRLKDQAADVDGDAFTEVVPVDERLKSAPRAAEQHVSVRPRQQLIVLGVAQPDGAVAVAEATALSAAAPKALVLADLRNGPAETDKEEENANDDEEEKEEGRHCGVGVGVAWSTSKIHKNGK
ncbi:hypothetical protein TYRP_015062 [Tyrophagus putrescentiae]|nr:hypothetical protein TYRP_015062 [Tyrophagus putrescentiae]